MACVGSVGWSDARKGILHLHKLVQKIMESEGATNPGADPCPFPYFSNACMRVEEPGFIEEFLKLIPNLLGLPKVDLWTHMLRDSLVTSWITVCQALAFGG